MVALYPEKTVRSTTITKVTKKSVERIVLQGFFVSLADVFFGRFIVEN